MDLRDERTRHKFTHCQYHKGELYTMFCITCDCLVCTSCILDNHYKQHEFYKIGNVVDRKQTELREMLDSKTKSSEVDAPTTVDLSGTKSEGNVQSEQGQEQIQLHNVMLEKMKEMESEDKELSSLCGTLSDKINERIEFLVQKFDQKRQFLLSKVKNAKSAFLNNSKSKKDKIELCISFLKIHETDPEFLVGLDDVFRVRIIEILRSELEENESTDTKVEISTFLAYTVQDDTDVSGMMKTLAGNVTCSLEVAEYSGNQSQCAKKETNDNQENQSCVTDLEDIQERTMSFPIQNITKIVPIDDNSLYLVGRDHTQCIQGWFKAETFDNENLKLVRRDVVDICPGPMQCFYLSEKDSTVIQRYTRNGKVLRFVDCGFDNYTLCLHFDSEKEQILAGIENNINYDLNVAIFDRTGQCLKSIPCGYILSAMDILRGIISWKTSPLLIMNNMKMQKKDKSGILCSPVTRRTIFSGAIGFKPQECFHPSGICIDDQGQILVSDDVNNVIYLLNQEGKFQKVLLSGEDLESPTAIAVDTRGNLWIGCKEIIHVLKYK